MKKLVIFIALLLGTAVLILFSGFTLPTEYAFLVLFSAVTSDFYTTWRCLRKSGKEGNPVMALMFRKIGVYKTFGIMVVVWTLFITFRWLPQSEAIQTAVAFAYWLVPANNILVLTRLNRKCQA